ncbi:MAG: hypothetical protein HDR49_00200 [Bacteroides sp.]|nr:hypothetical protein [Bacteroides sp.]
MKKMAYVLIVIGVICIFAGVVSISKSNLEKQSDFHTDPLMTNDVVAQKVDNPIVDTNFDKREPAEKPSPKEIGNDFENYIANLFKDKHLFNVIEWNQGVTSSEGVYAEADKNPDFKIKQSFGKNGLTYWVECKYRSNVSDKGFVKVAEEYQLSRYRKIQGESHLKVFLAVGIGGSPSDPDDFFIVPLDSIKKEYLHIDQIHNFAHEYSGPKLAATVENYFINKVFKKSKNKK